MGGKHSKPATAAAPTPNAATEDTLSKVPLGKGQLSGRLIDYDVVGKISDYAPKFSLLNRHAAASAKREAPDQIRNKTIAKKLLFAVAYGMESASVNINPLTGNLFAEDRATIQAAKDKNPVLTPEEQKIAVQLKKALFAEDLLKQSPEYLIERVPEFTDWSGRTFKNISPLEYAVVINDFKMVEMFLGCDIEQLITISSAEGEVERSIKDILIEQWDHVEKQGLSYDLTYDQPDLDPKGIPIRDAAGVYKTTRVTESHTDVHHLDMKKSIDDYNAYVAGYGVRTDAENDAYWVKIIGTLQRLFPVSYLQRFCCPDTPFDPLPEFTGGFKRSTRYYNYLRGLEEDLLSSSLSVDFALHRGADRRGGELGRGILSRAAPGAGARDLAAVRQLDEVSTREIENLRQRLMDPVQGSTHARP